MTNLLHKPYLAKVTTKGGREWSKIPILTTWFMDDPYHELTSNHDLYHHLLHRRGPYFTAKCCTIQNKDESSNIRGERFVVSNQLLQPDCNTSTSAALYNDSALITLTVMTSILALALFIWMANLFW